MSSTANIFTKTDTITGAFCEFYDILQNTLFISQLCVTASE